jgi:nitroreductase
MPHVRRDLASLGRHLQRSVLRTSLPPDVLRRCVASAGTADAVLVQAAADAAASAGAVAAALNQSLNALHAESIRLWALETNCDALRTRWLLSAGSAEMPGAYWALLTHPLADRALRHLAFGDVEMLRHAKESETTLPMLLGRRSVAPRRLGAPAPTAQQLDLMVQAALSAPDHGRLGPWRIIEFKIASRDALSALFEAEKRRRDPLASTADLKKAREHATQPPCLLGFVVSPRQRKRVPEREQLLAAGAALGNLLNAAHALGFGAIMLSGDRCFDPAIAAAIGLDEGESLAGFISIGSVLETPPDVTRPLSQEMWSCWTPAAQHAQQTTQDSA